MTILSLCAFAFFWDLVFIYAVDKLLFLDRGLSLVQIALLMSLWATANILFEVPSGILADKWPRKYLFIMSAAARALLCVMWFFADSFGGFLIGFFLLAISQSFLSGTAQAYVLDILLMTQKQKDFERIWGWVEASRAVGLALAWIVGGLVSTTSFTPALALSFASGTICFFIALSLPRITPLANAIEENPFRHLKRTLVYAMHHKILLRVFLFAFIVRSTYVVIDEYWAVFFDFLHVSPAIFGTLVGLATLLSSAANLIAYRFTKYAWKTVGFGTMCFSAILFSVFFSQSWIIILLMLALEFLMGVLYILVEGQVQIHAEPNKRATTASVASLFKETGIATGILFGWIASLADIRAGYLFLAIFLLLYFPITWILNRTHSI